MTDCPPIEIQCTGCGKTSHGEYDETTYCPSCGAGPDPWVEQYEYDWERDVDLPVVFSIEQYDDTYGLWHSFCEEVFDTRLRGDHIVNVPNDLPRMKYSVVKLHYKLDEDLELYGPYLDRAEARNA